MSLIAENTRPQMARMHSKGRGVSESTVPYNRVRPHWVTQTKEEVVETILSLSRKGLMPSEIGKIMRDEYAIGHVRNVTGMNILQILRAHGLAPAIPEDLGALLDKRAGILSHLNTFQNDKSARYRLNLVESRMYRLARYYKRKMVLPASWKPGSASK